MPAPIVFPQALVNEIVKIEILEMLEFAARRREQLFANADVVVHRAADIETQEHFNGVVPFGHHAYVEQACIAGRLVDRVIEVQLIRRAFARKLAEST